MVAEATPSRNIKYKSSKVYNGKQKNPGVILACSTHCTGHAEQSHPGREVTTVQVRTPGQVLIQPVCVLTEVR